MKILYDARFIRTDYHDGISRYGMELGHALAQITPVTFLICKDAQRAFLPKGAKTITIHSPESFKEPLTALILNKYKPDIVYSPLQTLGSLGKKFTLILSLHDIIYYRHRTPPHALSLPLRIGWRLFHLSYFPQRLVLNGADAVVTVSETSKEDILRARLTRRPVIVAPNAPQQFSREKVHHRGAIKNIVYMGSFMEYKNVETLIDGMRWLPGRTLHLLSRISAERRAILEKRIPKNASVVFHNGVSDETYESLLADNAVLASASLDEGYGLPVAEAIAMGVPAVISDMSIFHEVAGNGALYFAPKSPKEFAKKVALLDDKKTRDSVIAAGISHAAQYSWDSSARTLFDAMTALSAKK